MVHQTTFNIGLNNNPFSYETLAQFITNAIGRTNERVEIQLHDGTYVGNDEPTAVIRVIHKSEYQDSQWAEMMAQQLCITCTQECIPYRHSNDCTMAEKLVYHPQFDGDKYDFDGQYFIEFADKVN